MDATGDRSISANIFPLSSSCLRAGVPDTSIVDNPFLVRSRPHIWGLPSFTEEMLLLASEAVFSAGAFERSIFSIALLLSTRYSREGNSARFMSEISASVMLSSLIPFFSGNIIFSGLSPVLYNPSIVRSVIGDPSKSDIPIPEIENTVISEGLS